MAFKVNDNVLLTGKVMRKHPITGVPETLNLVDETGVVKKAQTYKDKPAKNQYHITVAQGTFYVNESKLTVAP